MSITNWPLEDRPREKLLAKGASLLTDAELIAICLKTGTRNQTALDLAKNLLQQQGGLKNLLTTPIDTLVQHNGLGEAKYAVLAAALELGKRYLALPLMKGDLLSSSKAAQQFLSYRLREHANEVFACLYMDNHLRLIRYEEIFHGTIDETAIYPREIARRGLNYNAAKVILAHNHPSGEAYPSKADEVATRLIKEALSLFDIQVVDHVIIGNPDNFSFAERGLL